MTSIPTREVQPPPGLPAAAFAFVLFGILLVFSVFYVRQTGAMKGVYD